MTSNRCWCFVLRNLCPSKSTSTCEAALEPSPVASFPDLLAGSFLEAISCEDTIVKLVYKKNQCITIKANQTKMVHTCTLLSNNANINVYLEKDLHVDAWAIYTFVYMHIRIFWWKAFYDIHLHFLKEFYATYPHTYAHISLHFHDTYS